MKKRTINQLTKKQLENKTIKCKITGMTSTELTVEDRGVEDVIPVNKIKGILFNREPAQFPKVRSLIESGSNEDAWELLTEDIRGTMGDSKTLNQEMDYLIARTKANIALSGGAVSKSDAAKTCEAFVTKNKSVFKCRECKKKSIVTLKNSFYKFWLITLFFLLIIFLVSMFLGDNFLLLGLFFTIFLFFVFYGNTPNWFILEKETRVMIDLQMTSYIA